MAYTPVSGIATQYSTDSNELASGYWLKFYVSNTSTPLSMATDYTGNVLLVKCKLNTAGFPITDVGDNTSVFIPYVNQSYRLVIFRTEADADANNTAAALVNVSHVAAIVFDSLLDAAVSSAAASAVTASTKADESAASAASIVDDVATATAKANEAAASASAAASSESAAATSETNAGSSETAAAASAAAASSSETASATSETNAAASAASVLQAEIDAAASAAAALSSENNSATSETNAAASASAALSSESAASTSETNATNAASAASTSETNALASKNAAAISATDAQASADSIVGDVAAASGFADAAQASYDEFVDIYHGALSSAPTTNLDAGDLYFDIPTSAMRVYDGALWRAVTTVVEGVYAVAEYTNIATQTTITTAYDVGLVQVLYNGVQLNLGDFTATNGTSIVLAVAVASATDVITVIRWGAVTTSTFLGTAATLDTGTAAGELPTNADLATGAFTTVGTAATVNTGVTTGTLPFAEDVVLIQPSGNVDIAGTVTADELLVSAAGGIGTKYGTVYMAGTAGGVLAGDAGLLPGNSSGTLTNGVYDLGGSPYRFKDLHLSGTAYVGESLGIGTNSPAEQLSLYSNASNAIQVQSHNSNAGSYNTAALKFALSSSASSTLNWDITAEQSALTFDREGSEKMRLDSAGNLLVGKTAPDAAVVGSELRSDGMAVFSRSSTSPTVYISTLGSDGDLISFRKDSTAVGSWRSRAGVLSSIILDPRAQNNGCGIGTTDGNAIVSTDNTGALVDGVKDLGQGGVRWRDLYLSGGVYLGGTGAANKLDDYEEGTWTPYVDNGTLTINAATYTKVGRLVTVQAYLVSISIPNTTAIFYIKGLPFAQTNTGGSYNSGQISYCATGNLSGIGLLTQPSATVLYMHHIDGTGSAQLNNAQFLARNSTGVIIFQMTYMSNQ